MHQARKSNGKNITKGHSNALGIMYQSRMRYLKSRDGSSLASEPKKSKFPSLLPERDHYQQRQSSSSSSSRPFSSLLGASQTPCNSEKLIPPPEVMSRERSLRRMYWKYHSPLQKNAHIQKMNFLERKEDPILKRKRDEIVKRIRAAESKSERLKQQREKERLRIMEKQQQQQQQQQQQIMTKNSKNGRNAEHGFAGDDSSIITDGISSSSMTREEYVTAKVDKRQKTKRMMSSSESGLLGDLPSSSSTSSASSGFLLDLGVGRGEKDKLSWKNDDCVEEEEEDNIDGDTFAFLANWSPKKKKVNDQRARRR